LIKYDQEEKMPRIDIYFDEMIKSLTLANLNFMEALLQEENSDVTH
jgi:hypothetical protein